MQKTNPLATSKHNLICVVCGWSAAPTATATPDGSVIWNTLPDFIFVRFQTRTHWTIPGVDAENVFPVSVQSKEWFLDAGRTNPKLKVTRYQYPLAPDFADTLHGAQGSTAEPGVIVDLCGVDPIAAYVGMTRSRTRPKILIHRPFPLAPFQVGLPLGRQLLLDIWKQVPVDWDAAASAATVTCVAATAAAACCTASKKQLKDEPSLQAHATTFLAFFHPFSPKSSPKRKHYKSQNTT